MVIGWLITVTFVPSYRVPTPRELSRLCAPASGVRPRPWKYIILHHSAGGAGDAASINEFHSEKRGWPGGLGYDFVIGNGTLSGDGKIEAGRRWKLQLDGAHCKADDMNSKGIGICLVGNFEDKRGPSAAQIHSAIALVRHLADEFSISPENVLGHGEVKGASTLCPGRFFPINLMRAAAQLRP
jgi:hypothetical protein